VVYDALESSAGVGGTGDAGVVVGGGV